jgi:hypothetical protein
LSKFKKTINDLVITLEKRLYFLKCVPEEHEKGFLKLIQEESLILDVCRIWECHDSGAPLRKELAKIDDAAHLNMVSRLFTKMWMKGSLIGKKRDEEELKQAKEEELRHQEAELKRKKAELKSREAKLKQTKVKLEQIEVEIMDYRIIIAKGMLNNGVDSNAIALVTMLSLMDIERLNEKNNNETNVTEVTEGSSQ